MAPIKPSAPGDSAMLLKDDDQSFEVLYNTISSFYYNIDRQFLIFEHQRQANEVDSDYYVRFLLDRKHVLEYRITKDRGFLLSVVSLAIGPHYFIPADFWDYENSRRFKLESSTEAVVFNLKLVDEFLHM